MKKFFQEHPALAETGDMVLTILSGSFALLAIILVWVREIIARKRED